jgi:hypothetical protein
MGRRQQGIRHHLPRRRPDPRRRLRLRDERRATNARLDHRGTVAHTVLRRRVQRALRHLRRRYPVQVHSGAGLAVHELLVGRVDLQYPDAHWWRDRSQAAGAGWVVLGSNKGVSNTAGASISTVSRVSTPRDHRPRPVFPRRALRPQVRSPLACSSPLLPAQPRSARWGSDRPNRRPALPSQLAPRPRSWSIPTRASSSPIPVARRPGPGLASDVVLDPYRARASLALMSGPDRSRLAPYAPSPLR